MSITVHRPRRVAGTLAATACVALVAAAPAHATGGTSAVCVEQFTATISPGLSLVPSSGAQTTHGETGSIACIGTLAGNRITGTGTIGYELPYTAATCALESGSGTVSATVPTTAGPEHFAGVLTVRRTALAFTADVQAPGLHYSGVGVAVPLLGNCVLAPLRTASLVLTGTLTDA